jgi:hypothetical protein
MAEVKDPLTREELYNNYEFRVVKKILKDTYPWIKDVIVEDPNKINQYNLLFVDIMIDPYELAQQTDEPVAKYIGSTAFANYFSSPYLSTFFTSDLKTYNKIQDEIDQTLASIHSSSALPSHLKLPKSRKLMAGSFKYIKPKNQ